MLDTSFLSNGPPPIWTPTPKQAQLLAADDYEVLYGGAAGAGKSDALLVDALCLASGGIYNPRHRAILFRRTYSELKDLIDRSRELYQQIDPGAKYHKTDKVWTFTSGAKIEFGHLQHDTDRFKYRGRAWNYIGFDELTLWSTPTCYLYLFSRCRTTDPTLPLYVRATTNPDGPGQVWVMERFGISEDGGATNIPVILKDPERRTITTQRRRFIPGRLSDNPYLDTARGDYRNKLLELPDDERDALLLGLWKPFQHQGAYYAKEMAKLRQAGRIRNVPYTPGVVVNTFWDRGYNDTTSIWFHQYVAGEHRFIHCYENSGEALDHYAAYLLGSVGGEGKRAPITAQYVYGIHYLPHDAGHHTLQTGKTHAMAMQELLPSHRFEIIDRVQDRLIGINDTRMQMRGNIFIDQNECKDGIVALDNYRKTFNKTTQAYTDKPLHDRYSNYADAFRQWGQLPTPTAANGNGRPANSRRRSARVL